MALRNALDGLALDASVQDAVAAIDSAKVAIVSAITTGSSGSTDTTLEAILTELLQKVEPSDLAALATAALQTTGNNTLASILAKITADPATNTTLAAVLAKISSDPATNTTLSAVLTALTTGTTHTDLSTLHTDVAAVLARLSTDPATNTQLASLFATEHTDLVAIVAKDEQIRTLIAGGILVTALGPDTVKRGTGVATEALPSGARLHSVLVFPTDGGQVTVTIPGQPADQLPADLPYAEDFGGNIVGPGNIVIAGAVNYYRVTWDA